MMEVDKKEEDQGKAETGAEEKEEDSFDSMSLIDSFDLHIITDFGSSKFPIFFYNCCSNSLPTQMQHFQIKLSKYNKNYHLSNKHFPIFARIVRRRIQESIVCS